jgi:AAA+ ATPase superfamily predicted ATPase
MIGRKEEVEALREAAMADRSRFVVVYGRRRVGKTFLIREAFDYRFTFSHTGMETSSMADQLESFHASLIDQGMGPCEVPKNWIQAFSLLKRFLKARPRFRKRPSL